MKKNLNVQLIIVDPQNDFMGNDDGSPLTETLSNGTVRTASLSVKGAVSDMKRTAKLIGRVGSRLSEIRVTLDSHHTMHIAHPEMLVDENGKHPAPYTVITPSDFKAGIWRARNPAHRARIQEYLDKLYATGAIHMIWPPHCRIGTWGHNVEATLEAALTKWERDFMGVVDYVTKGSSVWTEHFGGLMAEVQDPDDPSTQLNTGLITASQEADLIGLLGEASSHCVLKTVGQLADNIGDEHIKKMVLISNCMSPVPQPPGGPDFPAIAAQFLKDMQARGMTVMTADEFLA